MLPVFFAMVGVLRKRKNITKLTRFLMSEAQGAQGATVHLENLRRVRCHSPLPRHKVSNVFAMREVISLVDLPEELAWIHAQTSVIKTSRLRATS